MKRLAEDVTEQPPLPADAPESAHCVSGLCGWLSTINAESHRAGENERNYYDDDDDGDIVEPSTNLHDPTFIPELLRLQPFELPINLRDRVCSCCRCTTATNLKKLAGVAGALKRALIIRCRQLFPRKYRNDWQHPLIAIGRLSGIGVARAEMVRHTKNG
jgi:hypothetical protein